VIGLAGGAVRIWFDHADPATVTEVSIEGDAEPPRVHRALDVLFLGGWVNVEDRVASQPSIVWRSRDARSLRVPRVVGALARVAQLVAELDERPLSRPTRAIAHLELAQLMGELPAGLDPEPSPEGSLTSATSVLAEVEPDALERAMRRAGALGLVPTLRSVAERGGLVQLSAVADRLDHQPTVEQALSYEAVAPAMAPRPAMAQPRMAGSRRARMGRIAEHDRIDVPVVVDASVDAIVMRSVIDGDHLAVTVRGGEVACWLRVFGAGTPPLLLSAVPLEGNRFGTQEGSALLPVGSAKGPLLVDVARDLSATWRGEATTVLRRAVRAGREACSAERRSDEHEASSRWEASADLWSRAGDERRAHLASDYATGQGRWSRSRRTPQPPFVHERGDG
jgi:hypothetical protein